jgi:hypothetical protein
MDVDKEEAQSLLKELSALSNDANKEPFDFVFSAFDCTNAEAVKRFVFSASKTFSTRLAGLVHCAGELSAC